jgi:hypothetical protein
MGEIVDAAGREGEAVRRHVEIAGIGDGGHLDGRFRAVEEGIEHLRVHAGGMGGLRRQAVMGPDVVRRHLMVGRQIFRALARRLDAKIRSRAPSRPFRPPAPAGRHRPWNRRRRPPRPFRQRRAGQHVGLDIDHDDMLAVLDRGQRMGDAGGRRSGRIDDDVDRVGGGEIAPVLDEGRGGDSLLLPADDPAGGLRAFRRQIGDAW